MDRNSVIALILIAIIIILLPYYEQMVMPKKVVTDSTMVAAQPEKTQQPEIEKSNVENATKQMAIEETKELKSDESETTDQLKEEIEQDEQERTVVVENGRVRAVLSNKGGGSLKAFYLKKYKKYDSTYVNFIDAQLNNNSYFAFVNKNGKVVDTRDVLYKVNVSTSEKHLGEGEVFSIEYYFYYKGHKISKKFTFYGGKYHFDVDLDIENPQDFMLNDQYQIGWNNGIPLTEPNFRDDNSYSQAYVYMAEELENYQVKEKGEKKPMSLSGSADWMAIRTKYFLLSIINQDKKNIIDDVILSGRGIQQKDVVHGLYDVVYNARYNVSGDNVYRYYMGPLDYNELKKYGNDLQILVLNNGWYERTFRFFSLLILPILEFLHRFIPNYGLVIIIFSIMIKFLLYPLTKKSYQSMREMQRIQPLMTELRKKYKDDPQRLNKEMMKLYKEHGVNPMGGCLPMLLQMPLLFALFIVFRSTIQLRGEPFIPGWIDDLSRSEGLFHLPFSLPFYGNELNILPILMTITMIIQSKMTTQDPKQKAMIYIMPIFMLMIFNTLPSGLNLYYTMFNLLTIIQQVMINRDQKEVELQPATGGKKKK